VIMSLAVKYRPKEFSDMVGQDEAVRILEGAIKRKRSRVFIISGTRGSGKTTLARLISKQFNCGVVSTQDVVELDAASNNGVSNIKQDIIPYIQTYPMEVDYKLIIIDECHMLSKSAWGVLLKPLEEIPEHAVVVFCTTDIQKVPEAIISRSINITLKNIQQSEIQKRLQYIAANEKITITAGALRALSSEAGGSMREAITNLESAEMYSGCNIDEETVWKVLGGISYTIIHDFLKAMIENDVKVVSRILDGIFDKLYFFSRVLKYITENIVTIYTGTNKGWGRDDLPFFQYLLKKMVNLQMKLAGSDIDLSILIDAFFKALLTWVDENSSKVVAEEKTIGIKDILDTVGFFRVW